MKTLDEVQSELWSLDADVQEQDITYSELSARLHNVVNRLEEIIYKHNLWEHE